MLPDIAPRENTKTLTDPGVSDVCVTDDVVPLFLYVYPVDKLLDVPKNPVASDDPVVAPEFRFRTFALFDASELMFDAPVVVVPPPRKPRIVPAAPNDVIHVASA